MKSLDDKHNRLVLRDGLIVLLCVISILIPIVLVKVLHVDLSFPFSRRVFAKMLVYNWPFLLLLLIVTFPVTFREKQFFMAYAGAAFSGAIGVVITYGWAWFELILSGGVVGPTPGRTAVLLQPLWIIPVMIGGYLAGWFAGRGSEEL